MKLRDFVANSLPRVRGRKKKGQPVINGTTASVTAAAAAVAAATATPAPTKQRSADILDPASARSARQDSNGNWFQFGESRFGFLERLVGKESPVKRLFEARVRQKALACPSEEEIYHEVEDPYTKESLAPEDLHPYGSVEVTSILANSSPLCPCSAPVSPACTSYPYHRRRAESDRASVYGCGQGYAESVTSYDSTPGSQRAVRNRSRIRTNPWLPSPRPSPYCTRSLSSPCTSSRSPSPSSSPAPPSSSDNTSPLTSHSSDVSATRESHFHRHRRHRRHHSEVNAADFTRHFVFDAHLTDTEQYLSNLDNNASGVERQAVSPDERDKQKSSAWRKHRTLNTKRKSSERDSQPENQLSGFDFESSSPSKFKTKTRSKAKASLSSSTEGVVANRDSKFWDSDSSRSPPRVLKPLGSKPHKSSPRFSAKDLDSVWDSDRSGRAEGLNDPGPSCAGLSSGTFLFETKCADWGPPTVVDVSSRALSPCEDICVLTSNIEQLAQNISSEYEEGLDTSLDSAPDAANRDDRCASLRELFNIDSEDRVIYLQQESQQHLDLDYSSFAEPLQCGEAVKTDREGRPQLEITSTEGPEVDSTTSSDENMPTKDVGVQTDFVDDDEEENSGSDWLASAESGSDWLASNGSGSDWLASGGSGCDWLAGEGSGCGTEEEGAAGVEDEGSSSWEEGEKFWVIPDIMQDSTDTGYSSLSRDGRIVTDSNNNSNNNNTRNTDDSSDSANASDEKTANTSTRKAPHETTGDRRKDDVVLSGATPKTRNGQTSSGETVVYDNFDDSGEHCPQRVSYPFDFGGTNGNCSDQSSFEEKTVLGSPNSQGRSQYCSCGVDFSKENVTWETAQPAHSYRAPDPQRHRYRERDDVVPYPYDVTRFCDVTMPREERLASVSPCYPSSVSSRPDSTPSTREKKPKSRPAPYSSTPLRCRDNVDDDFCSCPETSVTSERDNVTSRDIHPYAVSGSRHKADLGLGSSRPRSRSSPRPTAADLAPSEEPPSTGRTLGEVTASLADKVRLLRQGKHVVSRKLREAREEEMVRQQQKLRFQRLLDIHRKQILLETLQDLRQKLESQSARLQASYSAVLDIQKRYA